MIGEPFLNTMRWCRLRYCLVPGAGARSPSEKLQFIDIASLVLPLLLPWLFEQVVAMKNGLAEVLATEAAPWTRGMKNHLQLLGCQLGWQ